MKYEITWRKETSEPACLIFLFLYLNITLLVPIHHYMLGSVVNNQLKTTPAKDPDTL